MSVNSTDPGTLFGGAWERIGGRFLLGADDTYTAGGTGGSTTMAHTHSQVAVTTGGPSNNTSGSTAISVAQMPSHNHGGATANDNRGNSTWGTAYLHNSPSPNQGIGVGQHGVPYCVAFNDGFRHTHNISAQGSGSGHTHTLSSHTHSIGATTTGGASNIDNMPPYLVVYMWQRTA